MIERAWHDAVLAQTGITALIADRIYPVILPQAPEFPCCTYQLISGPRDYTQDGPDGVTTFRIQTNLYGNTYSDVKALKDAFEDALSGFYNHRVGSPPIKIQGVFMDNERDLYESGLDEVGPRIFTKAIDFLVTASIP